MNSEITADVLIAAGYKEFWPTQVFDRWDRGFQKRFRMEAGTEFFLNFREWRPTSTVAPRTYDATISCDTATNGTIWATIKEDTLDLYERRARQIWTAVGGIFYNACD